MEIVLLSQAEEDLNYWKSKSIQQHPFSGIGKPELLKGTNGKWSRRINDEHRLVYSISEGRIYVYVFSLRYHYSK